MQCRLVQKRARSKGSAEQEDSSGVPQQHVLGLNGSARTMQVAGVMILRIFITGAISFLSARAFVQNH